MRALIFCCLAVQILCSIAFGKLAPLGVKDVSLMLRSGYSAEAVQQELAARYFIDAIDPASEAALLKIGAPATLIAALKSGAYAVPAAQVAAAKQEIALQAQRRALQADEAQKLNTLYQDQQARARAAAPAAAGATAAGATIAAALKGDLVTSKNGVLSPFNDQTMEKKKLVALYFSASWCGPCRKFTPELVQFYNRVAAAHPEFEIVFVSSDKSAPAMEKYMSEMQMPWPAVKFDKLAEKEAIKKYSGSGIPCLVLVDSDGRVISDSYAGEKYLGPQKVVADLDKMFAAAPGAPVTAQR